MIFCAVVINFTESLSVHFSRCLLLIIHLAMVTVSIHGRFGEAVHSSCSVGFVWSDDYC